MKKIKLINVYHVYYFGYDIRVCDNSKFKIKPSAILAIKEPIRCVLTNRELNTDLVALQTGYDDKLLIKVKNQIAREGKNLCYINSDLLKDEKGNYCENYAISEEDYKEFFE